MQATLKDVAERAQVSPSLVSHALNNKPYARVSPETRQRIQQAARDLNYQPNAVARGLSRRRMDTVGVVLTEGFRSPLTSPYFAAVVDGILEAASEARQNVLFAPSQTRTDVQHGVMAFREGRCDGLLLFAQPRGSRIVDALLEAQTPFVLLGDTAEDGRVSSIDVDNAAATARMVTLLLEQGHRRVAFLSGNVAHSSAARQEGCCRALHAWNIAPDPALMRCMAFEAEAVTQAVQGLMRLPAAERPTALCCYNDDMALLVLSALRALGLRVPEDVSVTGFDDIPAAGHAGLTTVRQPLNAIGQQALTRLVCQIRGEGTEGGARLLPVELVVRDSTAKPDAG